METPMTKDERDRLLAEYADAERAATEAARALHEAERRLADLFTPRYLAAKAWAQEEAARRADVGEPNGGPLFAGAPT
jgi:hypothetical protein